MDKKIRTLRIKGTGQASRQPDQAEITFQIETLHTDYQESFAENNRKTAALKNAVQNVGFERSIVKTVSFESKRKMDKKKDPVTKEESWFYIGYEFTHKLIIRLSSDWQEINNCMQAIVSSEADSELKIRFSIKDQASFRQEILTDAVKNARIGAETICNAAGVKLGEVLDIDYSWGEVRFKHEECYEDMCFESSEVMEIEPDDIKSSDTVEVVFEIK